MQPMPCIDNLSWAKEAYFQSCCGKLLCSGCANTVVKRGFVILSGPCAFCRVPAPDKPGEDVERLKNRMNVGDAETFYVQGCKLLNKNTKEAIELLNRAAELGSCKADCYLAIECQKGERVEHDMDKVIHHYKLAAIGGHEGARHNLAIDEAKNGNNDQAIKHWMIAAKNGYDESLKMIGEEYKAGHVTKDEFANTLRAHQTSQNMMKSEKRNRANDIYKRTKETRQIIKENLFKEPPPKEDCPICFLPMPHAVTLSGVYTRYHPCCGKRMCLGCVQSSMIEMHMGNLKHWCLFCRVPKSSKEEEDEQRVNKRLELNDAEAFFYRGCGYLHGAYGLPKDTKKALELWKSISAHAALGGAYLQDIGVKKDMKMVRYHYSLAAIGGHEEARYFLGTREEEYGNMDRAMRHYMISAKCGDDTSLSKIEEGYKAGHVTKEEYASTLRAYKDSCDEMKSEQRAEAAAVHERKEVIPSLARKILADKLRLLDIEDYVDGRY